MSAEGGDVRVLVVDDHDSFRATAREMVGLMAGFSVVGEAASGEEAITVAADVEPDLVVMDINLGAMDGIEATSLITSARPETLVVLVSTYELEDLPATARTSGAVAYLNKAEMGVRTLRRIWTDGGDAAFRRPA